MGTKKNDIHNTASTSILKKYNLLINGLYKEYDYLNIDKDEFNSLVLNIIEIKPDAIPPTLDGGLRKSLM